MDLPKQTGGYRFGRQILWACSLLVAGTLIGLFASKWFGDRGASGWPISFPEIPVHATATDSNTKFAAATNLIDEDAEGLFLLDGVTGELQCVVLSFRSAKFNAAFRTNVAKDLGVEAGKIPEYLLVTGNVNFRGSSNLRPARSVAYVVDTTTGRYAAYGVPWRREVANQGQPQSGAMALLHVGSMRAPELGVSE